MEKDHWLDKEDNAWKDLRSRGIGSSDIASILEISPWRSAHRLYLEKTNQIDEFKGNYVTDRGQALEQEARDRYEEKTNGEHYPPSNGIHHRYDFIRSSYDGYNAKERKIIEIKCGGKDTHEKAKKGIIPDHYLAQCQWHLLVSGFEDLDYVSWDGITEIVVVPVKADKPYQDMLIQKATEFWYMVQSKTPPAKVGKENVIELEGVSELVEKFKTLSSQVALLDQALEDVRERLIEAAKANGAEYLSCNGLKITLCKRVGSIDYSQITGIDFEQYRKPGLSYYKIQC